MKKAGTYMTKKQAVAHQAAMERRRAMEDTHADD
jgi:hypothetical protein